MGSCSSSSSDGYHPSDNYNPHQLYKNWMLSKDTVKDCKSSNKDLLAEVCKLKKDLTVSEKSMDSLRDTKKKLQSSFEMVSKLKSEIQSLTDTVRSLNRDYKHLLESKSNNKNHYDSTLKLKVATLVQNQQCKVSELELIKKKRI